MIFTAFAEAQRYLGAGFPLDTDRNVRLLVKRDSALARNQEVFGIAVNDHYGPYAVTLPHEIRDSGKILVLADDFTLESNRDAFEAGSFFAIRDMNPNKDQYPEIYSISTDEGALSIESTSSYARIIAGKCHRYRGKSTNLAQQSVVAG